MRTTLDIDPDILQAVKELGQREKRTAGQMLSELARKALTSGSATLRTRTPKEFYGFRPLPAIPGRMVTKAMIDKLIEEDGH